MVAENGPAPIVTVSSNLNVTQREAATLGADGYIEFIDRAGYDGMEWTPTRFPAAVRASDELAAHGVIEVVHESWRELTLGRIAALAAHGNLSAALEEAQVAVAFPLLDKSYDPLDRIQHSAGHKMPIIAHPEGQWLGGREPSRPRGTFPDEMFGATWFQLTAEWAFNHGLPLDVPPDELAELVTMERDAMELDGTVLDLAHLLSNRVGHQFSNVPELTAALVKRGEVREVQLTFRPDFGGEQSELRKAATGQLDQTEQGRLLEIVRDNWSPEAGPIQIATEERAANVAAAHPSGNYVEGHAQINASVTEMMGAH